MKVVKAWGIRGEDPQQREERDTAQCLSCIEQNYQYKCTAGWKELDSYGPLPGIPVYRCIFA